MHSRRLVRALLVGAGLQVVMMAPEARAQTVAFTSVPEAQAAWRNATNAGARQAAAGWLENRARTCQPMRLAESLTALRALAVANKDGGAFLETCAWRARNDTDPLSRHSLAMQQANLHLDLGDPKAAWTLLSAYLEHGDLTAAWRSEAARAAADVLATRLEQPRQAEVLLAAAMDSVTTNTRLSYAELAVARATVLRDALRDPAAAETAFREVLSFGAACPGVSYSAAVDGLAALLMASGRAAEVPETLLLLAPHPEASPTGLGRRLADCGASTNVLLEAVRLLRVRAGAAAAVDQAPSQIERLQPEVAELLLLAGRPGEALRECRVLAFCATDSGYPQAIELAARCFKALDGHLGRANLLLDFHRGGGTADGAANPLLDLSPLDDPVRRELAGTLVAVPPPGDWIGWRRQAALLSWLDRPADALNAARMAFAACPLSAKELQSCADAIARPVLVATRDTALAQRLTDYMLRGGAGTDGIAGTPDDIDDPFAEACRRLSYRKL